MTRVMIALLTLMMFLAPLHAAATETNPYGVINAGTPVDVPVYFYGADAFLPFYEQAFSDLVSMTEYMPNAPHWVWYDQTATTCQTINAATPRRYGINICTFNENSGNWYWNYFDPAGCPNCAAMAYKRDNNPGADWSAIWVENTDYVTPPGNNCGTQHNQTCGNAFAIGQAVAYHEMAHAAFGIGHIADSATTDWNMFGPGDFAAAEADFGASTVPYCDIFPGECGGGAAAGPAMDE